MFSLIFSSAGKGPFMARKANAMCQRPTFLGEGRGLGSEGHGFDLAAKFATFSEMSLPHFKTYFTQISRCYL